MGCVSVPMLVVSFPAFHVCGRQRLLMKEGKKKVVAQWSHEVVCFQMLDFDTSNSKSEVTKSNAWKTTSFLKEGAVSQNVLYHRPLPITRNQVRFYDNIFFKVITNSVQCL